MTNGKTTGKREREDSNGDGPQKKKRKTSLNVTTWNIQKINKDKCTDHGSKITSHIDGAVAGDSPFVVGILENKTSPKEVEGVLDKVGASGGGKPVKTGYVSMGGSKGVRENLVYAAGNGAKVESAKPWPNWRKIFDEKTKKKDLEQQDHLFASRLTTSERHPRRASTMSQTQQQIDSIKHPEADHFRSPVKLVVRTEGNERPFSVLMLHAPGPQGRELGQNPYAQTYVEAVCEAAHAEGIDVVQGDLNIYSDLSTCSGYSDRTIGGGTTTQNTTGRVSRLDRSMTRAGVGGNASINRGGVDSAMSDHFSLTCVVSAQNPSADDVMKTDSSGD